MKAREILKNMIQAHMAYPDKTAYKIADEALQKLRDLVEGEAPCASKELKLSAREKFIWLCGVKEYRDKISALLGGE